MFTFNAAERPKEVLFLCRDNGARSLMAEAILNSFSGGAMRAFSAGLEPRKDIPMPVTQVIESRGVSIKGLRPKLWSQFEGLAGRKLDFVFSICDPEANDACANWPGQPTRAHWHIAEPLEQKDVNEYYRLLDETLRSPAALRERLSEPADRGDGEIRPAAGQRRVGSSPWRGSLTF